MEGGCTFRIMDQGKAAVGAADKSCLWWCLNLTSPPFVLQTSLLASSYIKQPMDSLVSGLAPVLSHTCCCTDARPFVEPFYAMRGR
jgi:hypothetical protein